MVEFRPSGLGKAHEATGIHCVHRQCGDVTAGGARAASGDAGDGFFSPSSADTTAYMVDGVRRGLAEAGYVEGRNVTIEYRWADGHYDRLPELAVDLVRRRVTVIAVFGSSAPGLAAKAATSTIPIVFQTGGDPVADGLVPSMNRPGANATGVSRMTVVLDSKRLELLHEAVPTVNTFALLVNRDSPRTNFVIEQVQKAARSLGLVW